MLDPLASLTTRVVSGDLLKEQCLYGLPGPVWAEKRFFPITLECLLKTTERQGRDEDLAV